MPREDFKSHRTKVTITTSNPEARVAPDQIIYPVPDDISLLSDRPRSEFMASETETQASGSGCSAQTQKTVNTAATSVTAKPTSLILLEEGIKFYNNEQFEDALNSFQAVLKSPSFSRAKVGDHPLVAKALATAGCVYLRQDRHQHAVEAFENSMQMMRRWKEDEANNVKRDGKTAKGSFGEFSLAGMLNNLGTAKSFQGDHRSSLKYYWEALRDAMAEEGGANKTEVAKAYYNIGRISVVEKEYSIALNTLNEALRTEKEVYGKQSMESFDTLTLIGFVHFSTGSFDDAVLAFTEALAVATSTHGSVHGTVARALLHMGMVLETEGDFPEALRCYLTGKQICERMGLAGDDPTMQAAAKGVNDVRRELWRKASPSPSPSPSPSLHAGENTKDTKRNPLDRNPSTSIITTKLPAENKSSQSDDQLTPCVIINKYDPKMVVGEMNPNPLESDDSLERYMSEYREEDDTFWDLDDNSLVEETREI